MFVAATTECFQQSTLAEAIDRLLELEYSSVEITLHENSNQLKPSEVVADFDRALLLCRNTRRLDVIAYSIQIDAQGETFYQQFSACCKLAKATKVVTVTVPSAELGTPFNEEVEHLRRLVGIAQVEGVRVGLKSQIGRQSQDPDTVQVLCDNVPGLGLTLDPSHYIAGPRQGRDFSKVIPYVYNVHLRDSTKSALHVRVGQGEVDYGKLLGQLEKVGYNRALTVEMPPLEGHDHRAEMRKIRLLLDSLL